MVFVKKRKKMAARKHREIHDVEQTKKMNPLITCKVSLGQYVCELLFFVSMYLIWILGSTLILSSNQSSATLWVLDTCLIVGLLPFMIILQLRLTLRRVWVCGDVVHMRQLINILVSLLFGVGICASDFSACSTSRHLIIDLFFSAVISQLLDGCIHTSGHADFGIFGNLGASSIFTIVQADTASAACPSQSGNPLLLRQSTPPVALWIHEIPLFNHKSFVESFGMHFPALQLAYGLRVVGELSPRRTPGATTFPPAWILTEVSPITGHPLPADTFPVPTITDGRARALVLP